MKTSESKIPSKSDAVAGIAIKEFYARICTPFISLMSFAGFAFLGEASSSTELVLVWAASLAGIVGSVLLVRMHSGLPIQIRLTPEYLKMPMSAASRQDAGI